MIVDWGWNWDSCNKTTRCVRYPLSWHKEASGWTHDGRIANSKTHYQVRSGHEQEWTQDRDKIPTNLVHNSWILLLSDSAWNPVLLALGSDFKEFALFVFQKRILILATWFSFLARTKFVYGSLHTCSGERRLSWQQTFLMRVINLSQVRWFFSLLSEH